MSCSFRLAALLAVLVVASVASAQPTIVNFDFGAVPVTCSSGYAYQGPKGSCGYYDGQPTQDFNSSQGFGWMLGSVVASQGPGAGLTGPNTAFCPPSFDGLPFNQVVFLQAIAWVSQPVGGFSAGRYILSFYLGGRCGWGPQLVAAMIDGNVIGTWAVPVGMPFTLEKATFTVSTGGVHTLEFLGMNPGDNTAFLSYVTVTPAGNKRGLEDY